MESTSRTLYMVLLSSIILHTSVFALEISSDDQWLSVKSSNGPIRGYPVAEAPNVFEFLGIPYAEPPVDNLRFAPPVKYSKVEPYNASTWGHDCPQSGSTKPIIFPHLTNQAPAVIRALATGNNNQQSEDCLKLNVWTSGDDTAPKTPKAVLVFFHEGRFTTGFVNSVGYNGKHLAAAEDVIVVTLTYRLNIFGFPGIPGEPQNLGLRDQRMAVEWVRDNIAAFGGDPNRITIFGQSAGGVAVDFWAYTYRDDPIVSGLISESGNAMSFPSNDPAFTSDSWYNVSAQLGCGSSGSTLDCMRSKSWEDIKRAVANIQPASGGSPLRAVSPFYPTIDNETVFGDYAALAESGAFAKIPYLLGNNNHEQGFYNITAFAKGINATEEEGNRFLLESFTCPSAFEARARQIHGVPVWLYRYFGDWENSRLYPTSGAYHGSELLIIYGTSQDITGIPPSADQVKMTQSIQHAWAEFARDPIHGLKRELGWPTFDESEKSLIRLAFENDPVPDFVKPEMYNGACGAIDRIVSHTTPSIAAQEEL